MKKHRLALALFCVLPVLPVQAADCGKLTMINSLSLTPTQGGQMLVPVNINSTPVNLLLSTGGAITTMSRDTVTSLDLPLRDTSVQLLDGGGHATNPKQGGVYLDKFLLGSMHADGLTVMISPNPNFGKGTAIGGTLAGDLMTHYDIELDFAGHKLNYFSPDHCPDQVVYWPTAAVAIVPLRGEEGLINTHIRIPVTLDGQFLIAEIDTESTRTTMLAPIAERLLKVTGDDAPALGPGDGNPAHKTFEHVFSGLSFDSVTIRNPHVLIYPDLLGSKDPDNQLQTGSNLKRDDDNVDRADVHIGMDVLQHLHLYVAFRDKKLYVTAAGAPPPAAP